MNAASTTSKASKIILIADDQQMMSELWKYKFQQIGFEVETCLDGEDAFEAIKNKKYDMILLDIYMPHKTGFDILSNKASTINKDTPAYVITSSIHESDVSRATELGARKTFLKYLTSPKEVIKTVVGDMK